MCGFAGLIGNGNLTNAEVQATIIDMGETLIHRGPDDHGVWNDRDAQIALSYTGVSRWLICQKLATNPCCQHLVVSFLAFNGEIYNHLELRKLLKRSHDLDGKQCSWRGHSDTETLLAALDYWGLERTLRRSTACFLLLFGIEKTETSIWQETALVRNRCIMGGCKIALFLVLN